MENFEDLDLENQIIQTEDEEGKAGIGERMIRQPSPEGKWLLRRRRLALGLCWCTTESRQEKVPKIPADAIDREEVEVMNVHRTREVRFANLGWIYFIEPIDFAYL